MARPRLSAVVKAQRGTLRKHREPSSSSSPAVVVTRTRTPRRDYLAIRRAYLEDVRTGRQVACEWVRRACAREERDQKRAVSDRAWPYRFDDEEAIAICTFAESLPHVEGRWRTKRIRLEPWQIFILATLFGWRRKSDGRRRFTTAYIEVARKAAKSVLASIVALYCLHRENEPGAQVKTAATTGSQARIVFDVCKKIAQRTGALAKAGVRVFANAVTHEASGSSLMPINAKSSTQDGLNPHCTVIDELHAHKDRSLFDVLKSARGARKNPLSLYVTTAGYFLLGVAMEQRTFLCKILQCIFDADHYFGVVYTLDEGDDPYDESVWVKSNPMLGISPQLEEMRTYAQEAKLSPDSEGEFKTKRLNLWLHSAAAWISVAKWDACAEPSLRIDDFAGEPCFIGGDLAQLDDIAALAALFVRDELVYIFTKFYLPAAVVQERARAVPAYSDWVRRGLLTLTDGEMISYDAIEADIRAWSKQFRVRAIRLDQYGSAQMVSRLAEDGLPAAVLDKNAKTFTPPARDFETRVKHRRLRHDGNRCLAWMVSNAVVRRGVDGTILPKKMCADSPNKIDGVDAILQALSALIVDVPERPRKRRRMPMIYTPSGFRSLLDEVEDPADALT